MSGSLSIALAQINPTVGDLAGNGARILAARARAANADLMVTGELALSGYPPEDLVLKPAFLNAIEAEVTALAAATQDGGPAILLGTPWRLEGNLVNAVLLIEKGRVAAARAKHHLPNYGVFDEIRVFAPGPLPEPIPFLGLKLGVMICEDMWYADVAAHLKAQGADLLLVPNGSPFETDKPHRRLDHAKARVAETGLALVYVNQVGGQDELVFDGASFALGRTGDLRARLPAWDEAVETLSFQKGDLAPASLVPEPERLDAIYRAMMVGLRDYVAKNRFPGVIIGLSGGIDSALTAAVAADALGAQRVRCVMMPSPYTSQDSLDDAAACARLLGIRLDEVSIGPAMQAFETMLKPLFAGRTPDIAEENIQARARGITLMAISNKFGPMVLSTGNKSEMSVGYSTLYGDMCGGYSVLKDVYKTTVFALSRWRNAHQPKGAQGPTGPVMPERVLTKAPTAELRPNQTDQDSLPPYDVLDAILERLVEGERPLAAIVAEGFDEALVRRVWRMLDRAEYKRRQAPPGVKITSRAFGRDRRYPITNAFSG
ncbi:MAG: NAD+ synthase [Rhodospirillales bacterium]|nr:NAD+ synthase [Rhodospirillales bacterium]